MRHRAGIACGYSIFPVEDALSTRETFREENSRRIRDPPWVHPEGEGVVLMYLMDSMGPV